MHVLRNKREYVRPATFRATVNVSAYRPMFEASWSPFAAVLAGDTGSPDAREQEQVLDGLDQLNTARNHLLFHAVIAPASARRGETIQLRYDIETKAQDLKLWLGAHLSLGPDVHFNRAEDLVVTTRHGRHRYARTLTISSEVSSGTYELKAQLYFGPKSEAEKSYVLAKCHQTINIL